MVWSSKKIVAFFTKNSDLELGKILKVGNHSITFQARDPFIPDPVALTVPTDEYTYHLIDNEINDLLNLQHASKNDCVKLVFYGSIKNIPYFGVQVQE